MINVIEYIIPNPLLIESVVDANSTSATLSWPYVCRYTVNNCEICEMNGNEHIDIELDPNTSCTENTIESSFTWNNKTIEYRITQKPNIINEPRTEYVITKVDGKTVEYDAEHNEGIVDLEYNLSCGEGYEKEVVIEYSSATYSNNCDEHPSIEYGEFKTSLIFDCTDMENGGETENYLFALDNKIKYNYECKKCKKHECDTSHTITNITITQAYIDDVPTKLIPFSGASNVKCDVLYTKIIMGSNCEETSIVSSQTFDNLEVTSAQCYDEGCCKKHLASASPIVNIEGVQTTLWLQMERSKTGICEVTCEQDEVVTIESTDWILYYGKNANCSGNTKDRECSAFTIDSRDGTHSILELPVIKIDEEAVFYIEYKLNVNGISENCEEYSFTVKNEYAYEVESLDCPYHVYLMNINNYDSSGCEAQTPQFSITEKPYISNSLEVFDVSLEIATYVLNGETHEIKGEKPKINFIYQREKCSTKPPA